MELEPQNQENIKLLAIARYIEERRQELIDLETSPAAADKWVLDNRDELTALAVPE